MARLTAQFAHAAPTAAAAFGKEGAKLEPITLGHINATYKLTHGGDPFVLQRVNPIFAPEVNFDIVAIVAHLKAAGINAPDLQTTLAGSYWHQDASGGIWRLMTFIGGTVVERCTSADACRATGLMLGRFHRALGQVRHTFRAPRLGVHDTARHLQGLGQALGAHADHQAFSRIEPLAKTILEMGARLPQIDNTPHRIVHGDPKISNFIFNPGGEAIALIDLDTLASMPLALEVGDALRSWCSPGGEDPDAAGFVLEHFEAAMVGYKAGTIDLLRADEVRALPQALGVIATELAARFAKDALEERYFGWDDSRFDHAWQHNLSRAQSQVALAQSFARQQDAAARVVNQVFGLTA